MCVIEPFQTINPMGFRLPYRFWLRMSGALFLLLILAGCANRSREPETQLPFKDHKVQIHDLYCPATSSLVAIGNILKPGFGGVEGVALYSDDRGAVWRKAPLDPVPNGVALSLVRLPSRDGIPALYASGYDSKELLWWISLNGGRSWSGTEAKLPLSKLKFYESSSKLVPNIVLADTTGILVAVVRESDGVFVLRSTDWGKHWERQPLQMPRSYVSPIVSDERGNLAFFGNSVPPHPFGSYIGTVYWSSDAGATWHEGIDHEKYNPFLFNMHLFRSPSGKMVAFNTDQRKYGNTYIITSTDNGQTWKRSSVDDGCGMIIGIMGDMEGRMVAFTEYRKVLLSDDDGATWRKGYLPELNLGRSLERRLQTAPIIFSDGGLVIAAIGNKIIRSTNRGDTWSIVDSKLMDSDYEINNLCEDGIGLFVATGGGMITRSLDWGLTWQPGKME